MIGPMETIIGQKYLGLVLTSCCKCISITRFNYATGLPCLNFQLSCSISSSCLLIQILKPIVVSTKKRRLEKVEISLKIAYFALKFRLSSKCQCFLNNHEPFVESERLCLSKLQIKSEKLTAKNTLWTGCGLVDRDEKPPFCGQNLG